VATGSSIDVRFRTVDGVRIRYADSSGSQEPVLLLTSPWPESVYAFAPVWASLAEHARLFAVDLPGFGASERRGDLLSPRAMGDFLTRLIAEADLGTPDIVGPDVGTSAALFAAAAHPEQIASVIVGTGGAAVPIDLGEPLKSWALDPDFEKYRRMDPRAIVNAAVDTIAGGIPDDVRADYLDCYDGGRFAESMRYVRRYPEELARAGRAAAADHDAGHDHQRPPRPRRPARPRRVSPRAAARPPPRDHRRRTLRLGGGTDRVRLGRPRRDHGRPPVTGCSPHRLISRSMECARGRARLKR
jgi:pimeloyl-ACP methyl ester carboxylesterase